MRVSALFFSDIHLGSRGCNADLFLEILKKYQSKMEIL
jgi:UDP-2,3-diacylglucosamine pyrophosphatase LpxH